MASTPVLRKEDKDNLVGLEILTKSSVDFYSKWIQSKFGSENVEIMSPDFYADVSATMRGDIPRHVVFRKHGSQKLSEADFALVPAFDSLESIFSFTCTQASLLLFCQLVVPQSLDLINDCDHWSLVIICPKIERSDPSVQAVFWFADAAKGKHDKEKITRNLMSYLSDERFMAGKPPCSHVYAIELEVPSQVRGFDCGRFTMYFMQSFTRLMYNTRRYEVAHILKYMDSFRRIWFQENEALVFGSIITKNVIDYDSPPDAEMSIWDPDVEMEDVNREVLAPLYYNLPDDSNDIEDDDDFNAESLLVNLNI